MVFSELNQKLLSEITIAITGRCNLNCDMCMVGNLIEKQDMPFSLFQRAIQDLGNKNVETNLEYGVPVNIKAIDKIIIYGGEPILHPEFKRFVVFAANNANHVVIDTNLTTFPSSLKEAEQKYDWLIDTNISFMIPLDSYHYSQLKGVALQKQELRLLNFLRFCIKHKIIARINTFLDDDFERFLQNEELKQLLREIKSGKEPTIMFQNSRKIFALGKARNLEFAERFSVRRVLENTRLITILPSGKVFFSPSAFLGELTKENPQYLRDLSRERIDAIIERAKRRVLILFDKYDLEFRVENRTFNLAEKRWQDLLNNQKKIRKSRSFLRQKIRDAFKPHLK